MMDEKPWYADMEIVVGAVVSVATVVWSVLQKRGKTPA